METAEIRETFNQFILSKLANELSIDVEDIDINSDIIEYGIDSIAISIVSGHIEKEYNLELDAKIFFQSEDLEQLLDNLWVNNEDKIVADHS